MQSMKGKMKRFVFGTEDAKQPDGVYMDSKGTGVLGEVRAEQYLVERGYQILARNAVFPGAEIDLIAQDGRVIVFIEVKMRTGVLRARGCDVGQTKENMQRRAALYGEKQSDGAAGPL